MTQVSQTASTRTGVRTGALIGMLVLLALLIGALPLLQRSFEQTRKMVEFPYPTDQLEGTLLHEARLVRSGEALYQPLELHRFVSAPYAPLHPVVLALVDRYAGPHVFWSGRMISAVALLVLGVLIAAIGKRIGGSWLAGIAVAAVFVSAPPLMIWASRIKPDLFALMWTTLGLLLVAQALPGPERSGALPSARWLVAAIVSFALAFATKQTAVMGVLASGMALLAADVRAWRMGNTEGRVWRLPIRRSTLGFSVGYVVAALSIWLGLDLLTDGNFTAHVQGLHRSEWWTMVLVWRYIRLLVPYLPLALLAIVLWALVATRATRSDRALLPACYALVAPITLMGAAEVGANHNHLIEPLLGLSIAAACGVGLAFNSLRFRPIAAFVCATLLAIQIGLCYRPQPYFGGELALVDPPQRFIDYMRNTPGEILADDIGLLLQAGKPIRYDDPSTMGPAAVSGVWDQSGLIDDIRSKRFTAIMIPENVTKEPVPYDGIGRWTTDVRTAIRESYDLTFDDRINVYTPKP